jgi:hypothetical protein
MKIKIINSLKDICTKKRDVNFRILEEVIVFAIELAREGREGRHIGALFVVSDSEKTMKHSRCLIFDPCRKFFQLLYQQSYEDHLVVFGNAGQIVRLPENTNIRDYQEPQFLNVKERALHKII